MQERDGNTMAKDWMKDFITEKKAQRDTELRKAELERLAAPMAPQLYRRLCSQLESDVSEYNGSGHSLLECALFPSGSFEVKHPRYPAFWLQLSLEGATITYMVRQKLSDSATEVADEGTIPIGTNGQDDYFYRVNGENILDASEVSERLLRPLLECVNR
jgi:hypothetical protein